MKKRRDAAFRLKPRLPIVLQTEATECALACLSMIASYHGYSCDMSALRRRFTVSLKGTTLSSLIKLATRLGLTSRALRLETEDLKSLRRPCILHWNFNHFVVLKQVTGRTIQIHDPSQGLRTLRAREVSRAFTGVALELWPNGAFVRRLESARVKLRDLVGPVTGMARSLAQVLLLALSLEVFAILSPLFIQWVVDEALVTANRDLLATLAIGFALLVIVQQLVGTLRAWVIMHCGTMLSLQWHGNTFAHLLRLPMPYFEKRHMGDIVSRFRSIDSIQHTLTAAFVEALVDGLMSFVVVGVLILYSPLLGSICLAAMCLYLAGRWLWYRPLRAATEQQIVHAAQQHSHMLETLRGIKTIKLFAAQEQRHSSWLSLLVEQMNAGLRVQKLSIAYKLLNGLLFGIENVLVVFVGARQVLDGHFTVGMLLAFLSYKSQFSTRVSGLIDKLFEIRLLRLHAERLADIVLTPPESAGWAGRLSVSEQRHSAATIEVRGLSFRYAEHEPWVLDGIDLEVAAGECVAVTGPSGCGKTTLLQLMLGVLRPVAGEILIGGFDTAHGDIDAVRRTVGSVMQIDTLFAGSIAENISFFDDRPDQRRVEDCAAIAAIHDEIIAMPMAYNTLVGFMGAALSAGQQQRILLARALYKEPKILFLDEATSHLDVVRERIINKAIRKLDVTRVIVAHRPQTIAAADRVVTLSRGRIASNTLAAGLEALSQRTLYAPCTPDR